MIIYCFDCFISLFFLSAHSFADFLCFFLHGLISSTNQIEMRFRFFRHPGMESSCEIFIWSLTRQGIVLPAAPGCVYFAHRVVKSCFSYLFRNKNCWITVFESSISGSFFRPEDQVSRRFDRLVPELAVFTKNLPEFSAILPNSYSNFSKAKKILESYTVSVHKDP